MSEKDNDEIVDVDELIERLEEEKREPERVQKEHSSKNKE